MAGNCKAAVVYLTEAQAQAQAQGEAGGGSQQHSLHPRDPPSHPHPPCPVQTFPPPPPSSLVRAPEEALPGCGVAEGIQLALVLRQQRAVPLGRVRRGAGGLGKGGVKWARPAQLGRGEERGGGGGWAPAPGTPSRYLRPPLPSGWDSSPAAPGAALAPPPPGCSAQPGGAGGAAAGSGGPSRRGSAQGALGRIPSPGEG